MTCFAGSRRCCISPEPPPHVVRVCRHSVALGSVVLSVGSSSGTSPEPRLSAHGPLQFHRGTENRMLQSAQTALASAAPHDDRPEFLLRIIDSFCWDEHWMMLIGDEKGAVLDDALSARLAAVSDRHNFLALELGTYVGYSAVRLARLLPAGATLVSCDPDHGAHAIAREVVGLAGIPPQTVKFVTESADRCIDGIRSRGELLDFVFIDHIKEDYLPSLRRLEAARLLKIRATVVADNVVVFGLHAYLNHVRGSSYESRHFPTALEYTPRDNEGQPEVNDGVEVSIFTGTRAALQAEL